MKNPGIFIVLVSLAIINFSCQKDQNPAAPPVEIFDFPPQVVTILTNGFNTDSLIISIKTDSVDQRIELYIPDSANTRPFDKLVARYQFNREGYLTGVNHFEENNFLDFYEPMDVTINRTAENNITSIIYFFPSDHVYDTTFYSYEESGDTIVVKTINHQPGYAHVNLDYKLTRDHHLISSYKYVDPSFGGYIRERISCFYDNRGRIIKLQKVEEPSLRQNDLNFFYSSDIPDNKEDVLCKLFTGKDYFLPDIEWFYPFKFHLDEKVEPNSISSTNSFHITSMTANHPGLGSEDHEEATITYEMDKENLLSKSHFCYKRKRSK